MGGTEEELRRVLSTVNADTFSQSWNDITSGSTTQSGFTQVMNFTNPPKQWGIQVVTRTANSSASQLWSIEMAAGLDGKTWIPQATITGDTNGTVHGGWIPASNNDIYTSWQMSVLKLTDISIELYLIGSR